jgi:lysozyme
VPVSRTAPAAITVVVPANPSQRHPRRRLLAALVVAAMLVVLSFTSAAVPNATAASSRTLESACAGVALRTRATTAGTMKVRLGRGITVVSSATVTGGSWSVSCPTHTSGKTWYRISSIGGRSVRSLYGVSYLYAATSLFRATASTTASAAGVAAPALVATRTLATACSGVALRTRATTVGTLKVRLTAGARVVGIATVSGSHWRTTCAGVTKSGSSWYRISSIGGRSVRSLYGVSYLYAASSLFKSVVVNTTLYAACDGTALRTSASLSATLKGRLPLGAPVVSNGVVTGGSWSTSCPTSSSGKTWYRITSINGTSVKSAYGVSYLYAASALLATTPSPSDPTPSPSPDPPSPDPSASPAPSSSPSASASPTPTPAMTPLPLATPYPPQANACLPPPSPIPTPVPTPTPILPPTPTPDPSASAVPTPLPTATPIPTPTPAWTCVTGLDVSNWQGTIDWSQVAAAGYKFAFLKASEGGWYVDPTYVANRLGANAFGIIIGAYDFAQPSMTPGQAEAEADFFVNLATPQAGDLVPVLDLETTNGLSPVNLQTWVTHWLYEVYARTGQRAAIYTSPSFWTNAMGNPTWFAQNGFPLWVAHWTAATSPTVPAASWLGLDWTFWQWTSSGSVPGISGRVDLDRFHYADLAPYRIP